MSEYIYEHSQCYDQFGKPLDAPMLTQREEIVRCRDCMYYEEYNGEYWCTKHDIMTLKDMSDGFCKWGDRKEKE